MSDSDTQEAEPEQTFISHLVELRDRLVKIVIFIIVIFLCLFAFANDIYTQLSVPLRASLPEGATMIATGVASPFLTPFKLSLVLSVFITMPFILYQIWSFIAPGLYKHEKKLAFPLLISSVILFYAGMVFAYYIVFPLMFAFFAATTPEGVAMMTDISEYLDFVLKMFFAFGVAFEVPIATILLTVAGITTPDKLVEKRPYIIVGSFVLGMLLTPPDIISQTLLAFPVWMLFELGIIFSRLIQSKKVETEEDPDDEEYSLDSDDDDENNKNDSNNAKSETEHDFSDQITDVEMEEAFAQNNPKPEPNSPEPNSPEK